MAEYQDSDSYVAQLVDQDIRASQLSAFYTDGALNEFNRVMVSRALDMARYASSSDSTLNGSGADPTLFKNLLTGYAFPPRGS